ncbi:hypothetical protein QL995_20940 [Pseudoalteromonas sp. APC 3358]|uniref:hypothetical protein n=1 Tax=Pseudoalteromonas sp. APC 3358 TaxID=3035176 RepID=UPI0025B33CD9|nr:hypothetical protein [Pseudoalteromonas sp. APC 3358]MDN3385095.1 hypothetical protein [Pseudoalteromonas sp. APC 3358]
MADFTDITFFTTFSVPLVDMSFLDLCNLLLSQDDVKLMQSDLGGIDLVYWQADQEPCLRILLDEVNSCAEPSPVVDATMESIFSQIRLAKSKNATYLEFNPGCSTGVYETAVIEKTDIPANELEKLTNMLHPDVQIVSSFTENKVEKLPRIRCDSKAIKEFLRSNKGF